MKAFKTHSVRIGDWRAVLRRKHMVWLGQLVTLSELRCSEIRIPILCSTLLHHSLLPLSLLPSLNFFTNLKNSNCMRITGINVKSNFRGSSILLSSVVATSILICILATDFLFMSYIYICINVYRGFPFCIKVNCDTCRILWLFFSFNKPWIFW